MLLSSHSQNKSVKSILKSKGPKIEPCGNRSILDLSLKHSLILVQCVRSLKQEKIMLINKSDTS